MSSRRKTIFFEMFDGKSTLEFDYNFEIAQLQRHSFVITPNNYAAFVA